MQEWPRLLAQVASGRSPAERVVTGSIGIMDAVRGGFDVLLDPASRTVNTLLAERDDAS